MNGFQEHQEHLFSFTPCAFGCDISSDKYRFHIGFARNQEALTFGARRLNGEFLECGDRMLKLAAFRPLL